MIRLLFALLIVALLVMAVNRMYGLQRPAAANVPADAEQGEPLDPYARAQQFSEDYEQTLDAQRRSLDEQIDDG